MRAAAALALVALAAALLAAARWGAFDRPAPPLSAGSAGIAPPVGRPARVAVLGTSLSFRQSWPEAAATLLGACWGVPVEMRVVARPGAASDWGLAHLDEALSWRPDVVLIEFAANDASLWRGVPPDRAQARIAAIMAAVAAAGARPALMTTNPVLGLERLERPFLAAHFARYRYLAAEGAPLIDGEAAWRALSPQALAEAIPDGLHPTDAAARRVIPPAIAAALCG